MNKDVDGKTESYVIEYLQSEEDKTKIAEGTLDALLYWDVELEIINMRLNTKNSRLTYEMGVARMAELKKN